ncbi:uncharacterized protein ColSpa_12187 [Colletotrichum spaethianum]|uniref:Uncharacterized protein n=1 Tax=Colletotrichum spaethianum TaxID=700344 RepID=A0AA37ULK8_9PEZI|nr:uncharacterized protein ColSpa_12187 [Colletotrichum spaethianum]GKT52006.1 hypothetical protein ColSpa_12187 [Colletotrichum spaethianum]
MSVLPGTSLFTLDVKYIIIIIVIQRLCRPRLPPGIHSSPNRHRNGPNNPDDIEASTGTEPEPEHTPGA